MKHILLQKALKYKKRKDIKPSKNYKYDPLLGTWTDMESNGLLISAANFKATTTKKHDIETGEDQKR